MGTKSNIIFRALSIALMGAALAAGHAHAETRCFDLEIKDTPERLESTEVLFETWCYEDRGTQRLIYNADHAAMRAELAGLVSLDADGEPTKVVYASLRKGVVEVHASDARSLNPLPVPLDPKNLPSGALLKVRASSMPGKEEVLRRFSQLTIQRVGAMRVEEGTLEAHVDPQNEPYDGYWWPHDRLELSTGPRSPLGKYDAYVQARTGTNPGAAAWENEHHSLQSVAWGGHCNGWAASSVLFAEPRGPLWDAKSGQVFYTSDLKGILTESSFCVHWAFFGSRYRDSNDDITDIHPELFHKVLLRYIGELKKPVAMDYVRGESVDNSVISGYRMTITRVADTTDRYHVKAALRVHAYNHSRSENTGNKAYARNYTYEYDLTVDADGNPTAGTWTSDNPDFLWVPLSPRECGRENASIRDNQVANILMLPAAHQVSRPLAQRWDLSLPAGTTQTLDLAKLPGAQFRLQTGKHTFGAGVTLVMKSYTPSPSRYSALEEVHSFTLPADGSSTAGYTYGHDLLEVSLRNDTDQPLAGSFELQNVDFLAGDGAE